MLRCDNCNDVILEPSEEELKAQLEEEPVEDSVDDPEAASGKQRRRRKKAAPPPAPTKRSSLLPLPYRRNVNGYDVKDFDLCPSCRAKLDKLLDDVRFDFVQKFTERLYFIVPEDKWEEGTVYSAPDVESAVRRYNEDACVNVEIDVYLCVCGAYQYEGRYILHEGGCTDAVT